MTAPAWGATISTVLHRGYECVPVGSSTSVQVTRSAAGISYPGGGNVLCPINVAVSHSNPPDFFDSLYVIAHINDPNPIEANNVSCTLSMYSKPYASATEQVKYSRTVEYEPAPDYEYEEPGQLFISLPAPDNVNLNDSQRKNTFAFECHLPDGSALNSYSVNWY